MEIETNSGKRASIVKPTDVTMFEILEGSVFNGVKTFINAVIIEDINFDFPESLPLPRLPILENENVRYIDLNEEFKKFAIEIGTHIKDGVITEHKTYIPINKLPQDLVIFGKSGCGKTYFLARLIKQLSIKAKDVGILVLNVAKSSQEIYYQDFNTIKYSDENFRIPYFFKGGYLEKILQETATYICASLGLKNVFEKIIYRTEIAFMKQHGTLPEFLGTLLKGVENYVEKNPYGSDVQANLLQALRNRIKVFSEDKVQNVLKLSEDLPKWVDDWINGRKIFIDLSMCNKFTKALVVNAIFQLIRTITKDIEAEELKYLIVIDEAHAILEKSITRNSDDSDFIMKEQMTKIFSELLKEYRSRGVGFIIADQSPARLFDDVTSQPSIKIIFREDYPNNILFSEDPFERQFLTQLPDRLVLVFNGATGEKYLMKSLDHKP
jgi:Cdc6-like AAA superfamily ATPase